ncbi:UDP-glucuronosyltransferase 2B37-like isoform X2 [Chionomys nivalis]|uniref:UDP-glucuronosyltransferase 2B37-like isoform X2 n=1 Tax=Chionomys nivalis TaxID=269649 RepID=UPI00259A6CCD|nr:UDP-glucuronosyltransferase 2B37-like isoform X2 [Chionomys nivalis]
MPVKWMSVLLLLQVGCYLRSANCGKVLVWPMEYSHWMNLKTILDELVQRGHEVTVLRPSASIFLDPQKSPGLKFESFSISISKDDLDKVFTKVVDVWIHEIPRDMCLTFSPLVQNSFDEYSNIYLKICQDTVSNKQLMTKLQRSKFDVLFSDAIAPCGEPTTLTETIGKAEMWLIRSYWDLEFPRPTLPNVDYVGGLHCKPAKPLPKEMEDFVQTSGEHGIVVFSLGSMVSNMSEDKANAIAWALAQIPQKVLWRFEGKTPDTLGSNTRVYKWLPQNDLLGHPKTKAFVTHGGANGIYEAIHFGIPMIGIPLFGEQHDNIANIVAKGAAVSLDFRTITRADLLNALEDVIDNPFYKKNAMWLSTIHHDQPMKPLDRVIFWIEFVMRHKGAKHLRPLAHNLTWYQYHSLDVIGFLLACVAAIAFLSIKSFLFIYRKFVMTGKKIKSE